MAYFKDDYFYNKKKSYSYYDDDYDNDDGYFKKKYSNNNNTYYGNNRYFNENFEYKRPEPKKYKYSEFDASYWGFSGGNASLTDDDEELCVKESDNYFTPKRYDIEKKMKSYPKDYESLLIKDLSRMFYKEMTYEKDIFLEDVEEEKFLENKDEGFVKSYRNRKHIVESVMGKDIPGFTPLEKAIFVYNEMSDDGSKEISKMDNQEIEKAVEEIQKVDRSVYEDLDLNEMIDMNPQMKKIKGNLLKKLSLIKEFGAKFKVEKEIIVSEVENSKLNVLTTIRNYESIHMADKYQFALPNFRTKLALKDLNIRTPIKKTDHKQVIIIAIDYSGSMSNDLKQSWVQAVLLDRMKYVLKEDAVIYFTYYVQRIHHMMKIENKKDVVNFWKSVYQSPGGGDTDIGSVVKNIDEAVESKNFFSLGDLSQEKPEILIISDGEDTLKAGSKGLTYKTNIIALCKHNREWKTESIKSKGKYIYIDSAGEVEEFERDID